MLLNNLKSLRNRITCIKYLHSRQLSTKMKPKVSVALKELELFDKGTHLHGFNVKNIEEIPDFSIIAIYLEHNLTKAKYLHLAKDDSNNTFSINFRTTPLESTGLPHILEHLVLCGSKIYPIRDPFMKMLNRSLATYMNACTAPDFTLYPFSTVNYNDFKNLQSIYMDAVFYPNLRQVDFMQEGWRLEFSNLNDINSELTFKGVVFNEMKGVFAENNNILTEAVLNNLLPDHTYGVCSGGDPLEIPNLTWKDIKKFHKKYYQPSNSRIYSYGNFSLLPTLEKLNDIFISLHEPKLITDTKVPLQNLWNQPKTLNIPCRVDKMQGIDLKKQNFITVSTLMTDINDVYETFLLQFISDLLLKGSNSPLHKSLIEINISGGFTSNTGFESQVRNTFFTVGLQNIDKNDFNKVLDIYNQTIDDVIAKGFSKEHINSILNNYELSIKHISDNFGLKLLFGLSSLWNHDGDVISMLKVNTLMNKLRENLNDENYLKEKVFKYFKTNNHKLILTMTPDDNYEKKLQEAENKLLKEKVASLNDQNRKNIYELGLQLAKEQAKKEDLSLLPILKSNDIVKSVESTKIEVDLHKKVPISICEASTNDLVYLSMLLSLEKLVDKEQRMLLPLFNFVVTQMGTKNYSYQEFDTISMEKSSGLNLTTSIANNLLNADYEARLYLSSYCLNKNFGDMLHLWKEIFELDRLSNVERFKTLIDMYMSNLTHGLVHHGHMYASQLSKSFLSKSAYQNESWNGIRHIKYMQFLMNSLSPEEILSKISQIGKILFNRDNMRVKLNMLPEAKSSVLNEFKTFLNDLPGSDQDSMNQIKWTSDSESYNQNFNLSQCKHVLIDIPVYFCAKSLKAVPFADEKYSKLQVLSKILSSKFLHAVVREKNGAYGSGCKLNTDGLLSYYSYRDPNHFKTIEVFDDSFKFLKENLDGFTEQDIFEAKLGLFKEIDAPVIPANKGNRLFFSGLSDQMLDNFRLNILNTTKNDILNVAEKCLNSIAPNQCSKVILGPSIESFNELVKDRKSEVWEVEKNE